MNFVDHLLFYMKLLNYLFCDMVGSVLECYELTLISWLYTPGNHAWANRHCYPIGCVIKTPIRAYVVVVQLLTFLNLHFIVDIIIAIYLYSNFRGYFGSQGWWLCFIIVPSIYLLTEMVCICMLMAYLLLWLRSKYRNLDLCQGVVVRVS